MVANSLPVINALSIATTAQAAVANDVLYSSGALGGLGDEVMEDQDQ